MNLNKSSLTLFENERSSFNYIPPEKSNSFYTIGNGCINIFCERSDPEDPRFVLYTESGSIDTGDGTFYISGDIVNKDKPYKDLTIKTGTSLIVTDEFIINKGNMYVHGILHIKENAKLIVNNGGSIILYPDSTFIVDEQSSIIVEKGSSVSIYGEINVKLAVVDSVINNDGIYVDSAAHVNVQNIDLGDRDYSVNNYEVDLRGKVINPYTQGEHNSSVGRIGYTWRHGDPLTGSQDIDLDVLWGEVVLGDFKLSILGKQNELIKNLQVIESLTIGSGTTLYISDSYNGNTYIRPELYLGIVIGNCLSPGRCDVNGRIVVDGTNALITCDRGASLHINENGFVYLKNGSHIRSTHNESDEQVMFIDGTLVIDDISQIESFESGNISFGENGKVIILNTNNGEPKILWSTPNGIKDTDLYKIFGGEIEHVEYHIANNTGICIDEYYEHYGRDMTEWYAGMRIEQAIYEGLIVWEDGGFIELNKDIIPWVSVNCSLLHASRLFKSYGIQDIDKLQEVVDHLRYAGSGNIVFRFVDGDDSSDVTLVLNDVTMKGIVNKPFSESYIITTDNDGELFAKNMASSTYRNDIINDESKVINLNSGNTEFQLT